MRTTRSTVYGVFVQLCKAASKVNHVDVDEGERPLPGAWELQYDYQRKGYIIRTVLEDWGYSFPMGVQVRKAGEMVRAMDFSISLLKEIRVDNLVRRQQEKLQEIRDALRPDIEDVSEWMFKDRR
ncbi:MAG: hypothetical protein ACW99G_01800 [Candidatus Thorarchaeota archaeon]|jgi:hypothetical protein